ALALAPALGAAAVRAGAAQGVRWLAQDGEAVPPHWPTRTAMAVGAALGLASTAGAVWAFADVTRYAAALLAIVFIYAGACDLKSRQLPDSAAIAAAALGAALAFAHGGVSELGLAAAGAVMAGGALFLVGWLSSRRLGREALGLGDVKVAAAGGALLGPVLVWSAIAAAAIGTAAIAAALAALRKRTLSRDLEIPFGPGLLAAIFAAWIAAGGAAAGG
ncbi:MAG: hypothetical protein EBZ50_16345, partial [Alphaproteobacteria bacterium]|nr:hypothetical protein [Alphaproteobacteria bacterium]